MRTSLAFAVLGTVIAQFFRLQSSPTPHAKLGLFALGIPLACVCHGTALLYALLGAYRFWRQQTAIARGKVWAGGFELKIIGSWSLLVSPSPASKTKSLGVPAKPSSQILIAVLVLLLSINIDKDY